MVCNELFHNLVQIILEHPVSLALNHPVILGWQQVSGWGNRASRAGPVAQAMDEPIFETFQVDTCLCRLRICVLVACKLNAGDARLM